MGDEDGQGSKIWLAWSSRYVEFHAAGVPEFRGQQDDPANVDEIKRRLDIDVPATSVRFFA